MAETQTRQNTASQCHRKQPSTFKHWSFTAVSVTPSLAPSAKPEAEPVSIDIAATFTVFLRTFYSIVVLESNILAFHQQKLSRNNVKNMRRHFVSINNRSTCLQERLSS